MNRYVFCFLLLLICGTVYIITVNKSIEKESERIKEILTYMQYYLQQENNIHRFTERRIVDSGVYDTNFRIIMAEYLKFKGTITNYPVRYIATEILPQSIITITDLEELLDFMKLTNVSIYKFER